MRRLLANGLLAIFITITLIFTAVVSRAGHEAMSGVSSVKDGVKATLKVSPKVVDLFLLDAESGKELTGATVTAVITLPSGGEVEKSLMGMKMGEVYSYMNSLDASRKGTYRFEILVVIDGKEKKFDFSYDLK
jgi:hypothetical protein